LPRTDRGYVMTLSLYSTSTPARSACAPAWCERLSASSYSLFSRRVGLPDNVPNDATPEMATAGPNGSVGGALRSLNANCARVSFTVRDDRLMVLLTASVRSMLSRAAEALGALSAPAPRELSEVTLYWLYRTVSWSL